MSKGSDVPPRHIAVEIIDFVPALAATFKSLNMEWLADFGIEPLDEVILGSPQEHILNLGGAILFARTKSDVVGTCALIATPGHSSHFELAKMAVTSAYRGLGVGRRLLYEAITRFDSLGGLDLHLETSSRLAAAIHLYESVGFSKANRPGGPSVYARADVYMVFDRARKQTEIEIHART